MHLSAATKAEIEAEIAQCDAYLVALNTAYLASVGNSEIQEYRFDAGDGSQKTIRRKPSEIREEMDAIKAKRSRLVRQLSGSGSVNMQLRRGSGGHRYV